MKEVRLVDANKLMQMIPAEEYNARMVIANAPPVDAIPIEWIKEWINNYCDWNQEQLIECLLRTWSKTDKVEK